MVVFGLWSGARFGSAATRLWSGRICVRNMSSASPEVILEEVGDKGIITLNRPKALNALNMNMVRVIYPKLKEWESNKSLVIIRGSGEKAFCAGGDVLSVTEAGKIGDPLTRDFFKEEYMLNCLIGTLQTPYVALIDGITMGGGVGLSVHGQFRVSTERTMFAMPETAIGLFPDVGGGYFLPRLGGRLGLYLALTGYRLKGADVFKAGVATHVCESEQIGELTDTLLGLQSCYPEDVAATLDEFHSRASFKDQPLSLKPVMKQIEECFKPTTIEGILDNLEKDGSEWAQKQLKTLRRMSPTSMKITLEQLERGVHLTLQDVLNMEYRLTQRCCEDHDFYEGVRAVLVDRDNSPKWKPATVEEVDTEAVVERYFAPLSPDQELIF